LYTYKFDIDPWGPVEVVVNSDFTGHADVRYTGGFGQTSVVSLPAELLLHLGYRSAIEHVKSEVIGTLKKLDGAIDLPTHIGGSVFAPVSDAERNWADERWVVHGNHTEKSDQVTILTGTHEQPCGLLYVKAYNANPYHCAQRACECVNAMEGIRDPEAFIKGITPSVDPMKLLELVQKCEREAALAKGDGDADHEVHLEFREAVKGLVKSCLGLDEDEGGGS